MRKARFHPHTDASLRHLVSLPQTEQNTAEARQTSPLSCFIGFLRTDLYSVFWQICVFFAKSAELNYSRYETTCQPSTVILLSLHGHVFANLYSLIVSVSLHVFKHSSKWIIQCPDSTCANTFETLSGECVHSPCGKSVRAIKIVT